MGFVAIGNTIINRLIQQNLLPLSQATIDKYVSANKWRDDVRIGRYGKEFNLYKIRTVPLDVEIVHQTFYDTVEDKDLSLLNRILRKWAADEGPQVVTNLPNREITWAGPRCLVIAQDQMLPKELRYARHYFVPGLASAWCASEVPLDNEETAARVREGCDYAFMFLALKESLNDKEFELWYRNIKNERYFPMETNYKKLFYENKYLDVLKEAGQNNWPMPSDYPRTEELFFRKAVWNKICGKHKSK